MESVGKQGDSVNPPMTEHRRMMLALCEVVGRSPVGGEGPSWGAVAKEMVAAGITPAEARRRGTHMVQTPWVHRPNPRLLWTQWGTWDDPHPSRKERDWDAILEGLEEGHR